MKVGSLRMCLSLSLACLSISAPVIAQVQSSQIPTYRSGLKSIAIPPPTSDLNELGSDYRVLLEPSVPDTNRLIAAYMLADDAVNLRTGVAKSPSRYALVETSRRGEFSEVDAATFKQISATLAQQLGGSQDSPLTDMKTQQDELNHKLKAVGATKELTLDKPVQLGTFFSKPDAYGSGMIVPVSRGGSSIKMVSGLTTLRVQNRLLYLFVYALYTGDDSVRWVRSTSEQWADAILKANQ